jgi:hypothetical protein
MIQPGSQASEREWHPAACCRIESPLPGSMETRRFVKLLDSSQAILESEPEPAYPVSFWFDHENLIKNNTTGTTTSTRMIIFSVSFMATLSNSILIETCSDCTPSSYILSSKKVTQKNHAKQRG